MDEVLGEPVGDGGESWFSIVYTLNNRSGRDLPFCVCFYDQRHAFLLEYLSIRSPMIPVTPS